MSRTIAEIRQMSAYELATLADCGTPDSRESAGALTLNRVRDEALDALPRLAEGEDASDVAYEIADAAPDVYTAVKWAQFVDLAAYQQELEEDGPLDMDKAADMALYEIARRLALAIFEAAGNEEDNA